MGTHEADFRAVRFTTDDFLEPDRIPAFREFFGPSVFGTSIVPAADASFHADVTVRSASNLAVVSSLMSPVCLSRTPTLLADGNDDVSLVVSSGVGTVSQRGRLITYRGGDAVAITAAEPAINVSPVAARYRCFHVRRAALDSLVPNLDHALSRLVPGRSEALRYLVSYAVFLERSPPAGAELSRLTAVHLLDLAALVLGAGRDAVVVARSRGLRAARLRAIVADISARLDQSDLTVFAVSARHGITPRYVQLLFQDEGTTFSRFVLKQRLAKVHRLLTDPRFAERPISALALESGFGDVSYFNRAFRRRYGATPTDVREHAMAARRRESAR
jgi:AraC-like DNA-binding protein